jgi:maltose alpha-D-glucosyltransferase / alpha-amylase
VEAQSRDPHSILNWMRRMLAVRRRHPAFGRGSLTFLYPKNRKVLAFLREFEDETLLCVANVAHSSQAVELDLSHFVGRVPVELNAGTAFPPIGELTYLLTLPPYGFYWFVLGKASDWPDWHTPAPEPLPEYMTIVIRNRISDVITADARGALERDTLPQYIAKRRWFGLKDEVIESTRIARLTDIGDGGREILLGEIEVETKSGTSCWLLPLAINWEDEPSAALPNRLALARVRRNRRSGLLTDGSTLPSFGQRFMACLATGAEFKVDGETLRFRPTQGVGDALATPPDAEVHLLAAEQSNTSLTVGDKVMLKVYRRISPGEHPEAEMGRYLTKHGFVHTPPLLGDLVRIAADGTPSTLAIALGFIRNQGDAWSWILDQLKRALDGIASAEPAGDSKADLLADSDVIMDAIGRRLGEMHSILARETDEPAFAPEVADQKCASRWREKAEERIIKAFDAVARRQEWEREQDRERAAAFLKLRQEVFATLRRLTDSAVGTLITRVHGDFHLGQVLVASGDAYIIDFEGEPATSISERRAKISPLRDVAGLLRSIDYAGATLVEREDVGAMPVDPALRDQLIAQFRQRAAKAFLRGYWQTGVHKDGATTRGLLDLFLIEKAAYEISYEAANRPTWMGVPLAGLTRLLTRIVGDGERHG